MTISIHRNQFNRQPFLSPLQSKLANNQIQKKNSLLWKAFLQFPYYFQTEERNKYIKQQQQYQLNNKNMIQLKNHIIIKRVKDFSLNFQGLQIWVVNKKSLEVVGHFQNNKNIKQIYQIFQANNKTAQTQTQAQAQTQTSQQTLQPTKQKRPKIQNLLFFGKCNFLKKSITSNSRYVSNKHLILTKLAQKQQQKRKDSKKVYNFLFCVRKSREIVNRNNKLFHLDILLLRKIVGYVGFERDEVQYGVYDNDSKNGSKCYLSTRNMQIKQYERLFMCQNQMLSLCVKGVVMPNGKQDIRSIINDLLREIQDNSLAQVIGRNIEQQKQMGNQKNNSVLVIQQKYILRSQIHMLYSRCSPYKLYSHQKQNKFTFQPQPFPSHSSKPQPQLNFDQQYGEIDQLDFKQPIQSPSLRKLIGNIEFNRVTKKWEITDIQGIVFFKQLEKKKVQVVKQKCYFQIGGEKFVIYFNPTSSLC